MAAGEGFILVVDDDPDARHLLVKTLERDGYRALPVSNGSDAIETVKARFEEIDTIVLDLMMPGELDGYAVCAWLSNADAEIREIPVVIVSAKSNPRDMARSYSSGAFQHISKPYDVNYMLAVVGGMVRVKRMRVSARETSEKFGAIFNNSPLALAVVDAEYEILEMNLAMRARFPGVQPGTGARFYEFFYSQPRDEPHPDSPLRETFHSGRNCRRTLRVERDGEIVWWDMSAAPLFNQKGEIAGAVLIFDDVTNERRIEEQLASEVRNARKAEERMREALLRQDQFASNLMQTKKALIDKRNQLEEAYRQLEEANSKLEVLSITDELTGLFNRRHFDRTFEMEVRRARRYNHALSVLMIDIDHFKPINDTYGHPAGDAVLKRLAEILQTELRETDILSRYGGEEFVVVLPETECEMAQVIADRTRQRTEEAVFRHHETELHVTISVGIATNHGEGLDAETILDAADNALYEAKENGRNRVVTASRPGGDAQA